MSSTTPNPTASAYYSVYKSAVYFNLFVGIAWGGQPASLLLLGPHICSTSHPRYFCHILCCICPHPSVRFNHTFVYNVGRTDFPSGRPGLLSSPSRIFMLGMTTLMFVLSLIALVLETAFYFQQAHSAIYPLATGGGIWSFMDTAIIFATFSTIDCIMVDPTGMKNGRSAADFHV
jgi:hypothetical protein